MQHNQALTILTAVRVRAIESVTLHMNTTETIHPFIITGYADGILEGTANDDRHLLVPINSISYLEFDNA